MHSEEPAHQPQPQTAMVIVPYDYHDRNAFFPPSTERLMDRADGRLKYHKNKYSDNLVYTARRQRGGEDLITDKDIDGAKIFRVYAF